MSTSPTQRSKKMLQDDGYLVAVTERWNPFAKVRQDLFGFIDILAVDGNTTLAVQTTTAANVAARVDKMRNLPGLKIWLSSPNRTAVVHGWKKYATGKPAWRCRTIALWNHGGQVHTAEEI